MVSTYNLSELILIEATPEQVIITNRNSFVEWGAPHLTLEEYLSRERLLSSLPFTSKNFTVWILVPRSTPETTTNILSSCETFIRPALVQPSQKLYCYSIASVFTPPEHRKNGYASYMMEMLGKKLKENFQGVGFSFLYSDIGTEFYSRLGWKVFGHKEIQFNIENENENLNDITSDIANAIPLSWTDVEDLTKYDCSLIENEIVVSSAKYGAVVLPTFECFEWLFARTNGDDQIIGFVIWTYNFQEEILQILRFRSLNTNVTKSLIKRAKLYASHYNFKKITVWNPNLKLFTDTIIIEGGELVERTKSLPSLAWYNNDKGFNDDVEWILNENYAWC
ncbi:9533_t:CDS:2 [Funneliformis caledonium]|uniref:9533_t:CDS:1 n=1 Tax=Funneliformis caledonium TaxID=1117310 RepID=A0A9N9FQY5_9GLOM|nr:9533_t:CDS:2 [Funneliformis caledonium]